MLKRRHETIVGLLGAGLLVAGISSAMGCGSDGAMETVPLTDLRTRGGAAVCGYLARCGAFPDATSCVRGSSVELQVYADLDSGKTGYDGQAAARCFAGYDKLGCSLSAEADILSLVRTCAETIKGTVANGGACLNAGECVSQSCNVDGCNGNSCCAGTCQDKIAAGGDCLPNGSVCVDGTYCRYDATSQQGVCATYVPAGQPCSRADRCTPGLACLAEAGAPGVCGKAPAEGEPCPAGICDSFLDVCDASKTCVPRAGAGVACTSSQACVGYASCDQTSGVCVVPPGAGEACDRDTCLLGLTCINGICTAPTDTPACP